MEPDPDGLYRLTQAQMAEMLIAHDHHVRHQAAEEIRATCDEADRRVALEYPGLSVCAGTEMGRAAADLIDRPCGEATAGRGLPARGSTGLRTHGPAGRPR